MKTGTGYYPPSKNAQLFVTLCQDNACCTATLPPQAQYIYKDSKVLSLKETGGAPIGYR